MGLDYNVTAIKTIVCPMDYSLLHSTKCNLNYANALPITTDLIFPVKQLHTVHW